MTSLFRSILATLTLVWVGYATSKLGAWYQDKQSEWVAGQNETLSILSNANSGEFSYEGTIAEVIEQLNAHLKKHGVDDISVFLDLDLAREFSPNSEREIEEILSQRFSRSVEYENLHFLFYRTFKSSGFEARFIRNHVVIYPRYYSSLYSNMNQGFDAFEYGEGYNNFYSMLSYMNIVIPDEELIVEYSDCPKRSLGQNRTVLCN